MDKVWKFFKGMNRVHESSVGLRFNGFLKGKVHTLRGVTLYRHMYEMVVNLSFVMVELLEDNVTLSLQRNTI